MKHTFLNDADISEQQVVKVASMSLLLFSALPLGPAFPHRKSNININEVLH